MGLWVGHLARDQGTGFNPNSVLLSSECFPCRPLRCLFGWRCLSRKGYALSRGVCRFSRGAVSWHDRSWFTAVAGGEGPPPSPASADPSQGV